MSTIVVVKKDGEICIGADTLTKLGRIYQRRKYLANSSKILKTGTTYIGTVGVSVWHEVLASCLSRRRKKMFFNSVQAIFESFRYIHARLKKDYFLNPRENEDDEFESSQLHALIANPHGIFGIYSLRSVQEFKRFFAFGSGSDFALGAMYTVYDRKLTARRIAEIALTAAAEFDDSTGEPFDLHEFKARR
ncbi:MAG: MFS transporter [Kiritimatiellae bacterium]|nr:MFS transporter [Kiritimatiellia bacterium]